MSDPPSWYSAWLRVTRSGGVEIGRAAELRDALRDLVRVTLLLVGVGQELLRHRLRVDTAGHEVVAAVAQHAHDLGGQRVVEQANHRLAIAAITLGHGAIENVLARAAPELLHVSQEGLLGITLLRLSHARQSTHESPPRQARQRRKIAWPSASDGARPPL